MREAIFAITICLSLLGAGLTNVVSQPCQELKNGICSTGQYLVNVSHRPTCLQCPDNSFVAHSSHNCEKCQSHSVPRANEIVETQGNATADSIIVCKSGFYRTQSLSQGECQRCSVCKPGYWTGKECGTDGDTVCCKEGLTAVQESVCVLLVLDLQHLPDTNKARSTRTANATFLGNEEENQDTVGEYSYSTGEEEKKRVMVDIPVWARYMCLGIAIGIIVFFLVVGIPCNACGSLDKLRQIRDRITKGSNSQNSDEESKRPISPQPDDA